MNLSRTWLEGWQGRQKRQAEKERIDRSLGSEINVWIFFWTLAWTLKILQACSVMDVDRNRDVWLATHLEHLQSVWWWGTSGVLHRLQFLFDFFARGMTSAPERAIQWQEHEVGPLPWATDPRNIANHILKWKGNFWINHLSSSYIVVESFTISLSAPTPSASLGKLKQIAEETKSFFSGLTCSP